MFSDIKITTGMLYQGALFFALIDAVYIPLLTWRVKREAFHRMKWFIVIAAAFTWFGIWSWAIGNFWEAFYFYVFPTWAQTWTPRIAFFSAGALALGLWALSIRLKWNVILIFCLTGGVIGILTHIWAVYRGAVSKSPMIQGASPLAAIVIAFFEYIFYWCVILTAAKLMDWVTLKLRTSSS